MRAPEEPYEHASCGLITLDPKGVIEIANPVMSRLANIARADLVGRRFQDLFRIGSRLFLQTHWWPLLELQGSVAEVHLDLLDGNGGTVPTLVNALRRDDGRTDISVFVATDRRKYEQELLLARRRAEELAEAIKDREQQFRRLAENSPDTIVRVDGENRIAYVSRPADPFTGGPSAELIGKTVAELPLPPDLAAGISHALGEAAEGREARVGFERDEGRLELEARFVPERGPTGSSTLVVVRDLTALNEQAREAARRALLAEQLIGIVSHDLRNPLNAIALGTQLLSTADLGRNASTVQRITNAANRAIRLTAELLDFTQARIGGGLRMNPVPLDVHAVVAEAVEELRLAWAGRAIAHRREGAGSAVADPDRLAQIVTNLVSNAMVYGTKETPVAIASIVLDHTIEIRVHNQGKPIPPELQQAIFEPLSRGEEQVQRGSRSVGLGLYIVRQIARSHHGDATVSSDETGTEFRVTLPRGV